jgi:sugar/nucleoside kinase (ribokinase family)
MRAIVVGPGIQGRRRLGCAGADAAGTADPLDPVGAGDALLACATLALRATGDPVVASILATMAAGVACEHDGNTPVTPEQVLGKLAVIEKRVQYA